MIEVTSLVCTGCGEVKVLPEPVVVPDDLAGYAYRCAVCNDAPVPLATDQRVFRVVVAVDELQADATHPAVPDQWVKVGGFTLRGAAPDLARFSDEQLGEFQRRWEQMVKWAT